MPIATMPPFFMPTVSGSDDVPTVTVALVEASQVGAPIGHGLKSRLDGATPRTSGRPTPESGTLTGGRPESVIVIVAGSEPPDSRRGR